VVKVLLQVVSVLQIEQPEKVWQVVRQGQPGKVLVAYNLTSLMRTNRLQTLVPMRITQ
jgi:hypothetical protein